MMEKVWRCTVCGYIHKGDSPPEVCPICGVDASKFELVSDPDSVETSGKQTWLGEITRKAKALLREMKAAFVPHAVSAHFPNALLPTCFLFLILTIISGKESFELTTFYLLFVAVLSVPVTFVTGLVAWRQKYAGEFAPIFRKKIILATVLSLLGLITASWRWYNPEVFSSGGFSACVYSVLLLAMLVCVTLLGHLGGLLVFAKQRQNQRRTTNDG